MEVREAMLRSYRPITFVHRVIGGKRGEFFVRRCRPAIFVDEHWGLVGSRGGQFFNQRLRKQWRRTQNKWHRTYVSHPRIWRHIPPAYNIK
jgi:hypothetical protein